MTLTSEQIVYKRIDEILWNNWDPIGINDSENARDEYHHYLPKVFSLKIEGVDAETLARYLFKVETEAMGLDGDIETCGKVATKIMNL